MTEKIFSLTSGFRNSKSESKLGTQHYLQNKEKVYILKHIKIITGNAWWVLRSKLINKQTKK